MFKLNELIEKLSRKTTLCCGAAFIAMQFANTASAIKVKYTLDHNSFGTYLHDAEPLNRYGNPTRRGHFTVGPNRARYNGSFTGDFNNRVLTNIQGELTGTLGNMAAVFNADANDPFVLKFTDGAIHGGLRTNGTVGGNEAGGFINYGVMIENNLVDSGTFYFYPQNFTSLAGPDPNYLAKEQYWGGSYHDIILWGNNWINRETSSSMGITPSLTTWNNIWQSLGFGADQNGDQIVPGTGIEIAKYTDGGLRPPSGFNWLGTDIIAWAEEIPDVGPGPGPAGQTTPPGAPEPVTATMAIMAMGALSTTLRRRR